VDALLFRTRRWGACVRVAVNDGDPPWVSRGRDELNVANGGVAADTQRLQQEPRQVEVRLGLPGTLGATLHRTPVDQPWPVSKRLDADLAFTRLVWRETCPVLGAPGIAIASGAKEARNFPFLLRCAACTAFEDGADEGCLMLQLVLTVNL
jgi:hypothetical protein